MIIYDLLVIALILWFYFFKKEFSFVILKGQSAKDDKIGHRNSVWITDLFGKNTAIEVSCMEKTLFHWRTKCDFSDHKNTPKIFKTSSFWFSICGSWCPNLSCTYHLVSSSRSLLILQKGTLWVEMAVELKLCSYNSVCPLSEFWFFNSILVWQNI